MTRPGAKSRLRPRIGSRLARGAEGLERHTLPLGIAVIAVAVVLSAISIASINGLPLSHPYELEAVVPAEAPIVRPGDEVRVAGARVGEVREVTPDPEGRLVRMELTDGAATRDASARVRLRGLAGAVFIELDRGAGEPAPDGFTIPRERTATGTQLTDVVGAFDRETSEALGRSLRGYGAGIAGRGPELNAALADLPPLLEKSEPLLRAANPKPGALSGFVADAGRTARGFAGRDDDDLAEAISGAADTFEATGDEHDSLGQAIQAAPGTLDEATATLPAAAPLLADLDRASTALSPGVRSLAGVLPRVNDLLARRASVARLGHLANRAHPVLRAAGPVLQRLAPAAGTLAPLIEAVTPLAGYLAQFPEEVLAGPTGFTTWGDFKYSDGQAPGARAVRFTPVLTPPADRDPYPEPGAVAGDRESFLP